MRANPAEPVGTYHIRSAKSRIALDGGGVAAVVFAPF